MMCFADLLNGGSTESLNDAPRELESGSLLVTSVPADGRVVLQLPRGNLETISPRVLVLDRVCDHLDRLVSLVHRCVSFRGGSSYHYAPPIQTFCVIISFQKGIQRCISFDEGESNWPKSSLWPWPLSEYSSAVFFPSPGLSLVGGGKKCYHWVAAVCLFVLKSIRVTGRNSSSG